MNFDSPPISVQLIGLKGEEIGFSVGSVVFYRSRKGLRILEDRMSPETVGKE